jgi:hypothetical protein
VSKVSYVTASTRQRAWWDDLYQLDRTPMGFDRIQVYEAGNESQPTGLLDAQGDQLFRVVQKRPIGFIAPKEEI